MKDYRWDVYAAKIETLSWKDKDLTLRLRDHDWHRTSIVVVVFIGVAHIESVEVRNELAQPDFDELKPGWSPYDLTFDQGVASLGVDRPDDMTHERFSVRHNITCTDVIVTRRLALLRTFLRYLY